METGIEHYAMGFSSLVNLSGSLTLVTVGGFLSGTRRAGKSAAATAAAAATGDVVVDVVTVTTSTSISSDSSLIEEEAAEAAAASKANARLVLMTKSGLATGLVVVDLAQIGTWLLGLRRPPPTMLFGIVTLMAASRGRGVNTRTFIGLLSSVEAW